jgi:hypothetical protein
MPFDCGNILRDVKFEIRNVVLLEEGYYCNRKRLLEQQLLGDLEGNMVVKGSFSIGYEEIKNARCSLPYETPRDPLC